MMDGTNGAGRALRGLSVYDRLRCHVIGQQETSGSGHPVYTQAGYLMHCSGECGIESCGKKRQGGVGLAVRSFVTRAARSPKFISDHLLKAIRDLRSRAKAVTFIVAYAPPETQNASNKHAFWTTLDRAAKQVPKHRQMLVLMDATPARGGGRREGCGARISKF